jgi:hypothetical protein
MAHDDTGPLPRAKKSLCALRTLLTSFRARADTRFSTFAARTAPRDPSKLALLLAICGYAVRRDGDKVEVLGREWVPALIPREQALTAYLEKQCTLMAPQEPMDPNDERFDLVFAE